MDIAIQFKREEVNLITACVRGEKWAQKQLYETHYGKMMGICLRYSNNKEDALDILHEGFIKVFKHIGKYQPCLLYTSPSPRDKRQSRMPSSA